MLGRTLICALLTINITSGIRGTASAFSPSLIQISTRTSTNIPRGDWIHKPRQHESLVGCRRASVDSAIEPFEQTVQRKYQTFRWFHNETNAEYDINYRVEGEGPPILLIHGFGANVNHFRHQFPALVDQGYQVQAIDLLGFGASDKPHEPEYSIELFVELLKDFVEHKHQGEEWFVAGNSIGGLCSLGLAEQLPHVVRGVILFNCAGGMTGFRYEDVPVYIRPILFFLQKVVLGPLLGGYFFSNFKTRENVESILKTQGVYRDITNVDEMLLEILLGPSDDDGAEMVFLKTFAGPPGPTPESILPNLSCPILAVWGGADPWTPVDGGMHPGTEFHKFANDNFDLIVLEGAGHCPHDEAPDQVHAAMLPWMRTILSESKVKSNQ